MCEPEAYTLRLLREEEQRVKRVCSDQNISILNSLRRGIQLAEKAFETCEYKECMASLPSSNPTIVDLKTLSTLYSKSMNCKRSS